MNISHIKKFYNKADMHLYSWCDDLYNYIIKVNPSKVIEIGCGSGCTTSTMCQALYDLNNDGKLLTMDLDENLVKDTDKIIKNNFEHLSDIYESSQSDFFEYEFEDNFDLLYLDIHNTEDTFLILKEKLKKNNLMNKLVLAPNTTGSLVQIDMISYVFRPVKFI